MDMGKYWRTWVELGGGGVIRGLQPRPHRVIIIGIATASHTLFRLKVIVICSVRSLEISYIVIIARPGARPVINSGERFFP